MPIELVRITAWRPPGAAPHAGASPCDDHRRRAFEQIYREHYTTIAAYLYRRTARLHLAEDLAAETFLIAFRSVDRIHAAGLEPKHWLLRVATNAANRWQRDQKRRLRRERARPADPDASPPDWTPQQLSVRAAVAQLPPRFQDVITLHYFAGLSIAEIARVLDCREGTVKSRLARGRDRVRELLTSAGGVA